MNAFLRILLIAVVAMLSGPRVGLAADGEWTVICDGVSGEAKQVLFDFRTGAPAQPEVVIETCDYCLIVDTAERPRIAARADAVLTLILAVTPDDRRARRAANYTAGARAPPVLSEA